jgi:hypothetical protein
VEVRFTKLSDQRHAVTVVRDDGSTERVELDSRSFLRHDLAHFAVEGELGISGGVWGSVAVGGSLAGEGLDGAEVGFAESLAGPVQTLMRVGAGPEQYLAVLEQVTPDQASADRGARLHERIRQLSGHWRSTPYGGDMVLAWPAPAIDPAR